MSRAPGELSIICAKKKFFHVNDHQRKVMSKHRLLLRAHIDEAINAGLLETVYQVPPVLSGAYAEYDVHEVGLRLMRQARAGGFDVNLVTTQPFCFRLTGWGDETWVEEHRPGKTKKRVTIQSKPPAKKYSAKPLPSTQAKCKYSPEEASALAQQSSLSSRLRASLGRAV